MKKYFFISDLHIGAGADNIERDKLNRIKSFFDFIKPLDCELFIVGDLFDFWFEYKHVIPSISYSILFEISKLIEAGIQVHFLPGNHDSWIRDFFSKQMKIIVHEEKHTTKVNSKKLYLFHGDGILKKDVGYRLLKRIFRNPVNIFLYRWIHPDLGVPLAKHMSQTSRNHTSGKIYNFEEEYLEYAKKKFKLGFDYVILGHTHRPAYEKFNEHVLVNLGDWMVHNSYALLDENGLSLNFWNSNSQQ